MIVITTLSNNQLTAFFSISVSLLAAEGKGLDHEQPFLLYSGFMLSSRVHSHGSGRSLERLEICALRCSVRTRNQVP